MYLLAAGLLTVYGLSRVKAVPIKTVSHLEHRKLSDGRNTANNDRTNLLFNPKRLWKENALLGNWPWSSPAVRPPLATKPYFRKPTPHLANVVDWADPKNAWLRTPEYRELFVKTYKTAWSTESAFATRTNLVDGFHRELITKGRVLTQESKANGVYNPNGPNLYRYHYTRG